MKELTLEKAALAWAQGKRVLAAPIGSVNWKPIIPLGGGEGGYTPNVFNERKEPFRFRLAPELPAVGTAEWANSLPEGTKLRVCVWTLGRFTEKRNGVWSKWSELSWTPDDGPNTGWELYQEPPVKKFRPWTLEEVPVGAFTKPKSGGDLLMIIGRLSSGALLAGDGGIYPLHDLLKLREHSLDGAKTWLPCGVEVDE